MVRNKRERRFEEIGREIWDLGRDSNVWSMDFGDVDLFEERQEYIYVYVCAHVHTSVY